MRAKSAEAVVRMMVAKDPRQSVDTMLEFLIGVNDAGSGAVFAIQDGPRLVIGHGLTQSALEWTASRWSQEEPSLAQGRVSRTDACFLLPVLKRDHLVALVFLATSQVDLDSLAEVSGMLADAVGKVASRPEPLSSVEAYLEQNTTEEIERRRLLLLLDRFEWNLARVARELRISRTTLYKRLTDFGIDRQRVPKGPRGAETSEA